MPAYLIVRVNVTDMDQYAQYMKLTPAILEKYGGEFVIRGGEKHVLEGPEIDERIVLLKFADVETAKGMYNSDRVSGCDQSTRRRGRGICRGDGGVGVGRLVIVRGRDSGLNRLVFFFLDVALLISRATPER